PASDAAPAASTPALPLTATSASGLTGSCNGADGSGSDGSGSDGMPHGVPASGRLPSPGQLGIPPGGAEYPAPRGVRDHGGGAGPLVVVDGANVVGSRPDGWWRARPAAARRLLATLTAGVPLAGEVVLVLEGAARAGVPAGRVEGVRVVHAA